MTSKTIRAAICAAALAWAGAAHAGDTEDFSGCDGRMKPKSKEDGMRGAASISAFGRFGGAAGPKATIDACNRALANAKLLPTQTLRKAHLLRARAAAFLEQGETASALADLDGADTLFAPLAAEPLQRRSMGASLTLLRAIARAQSGDMAEAARLAEEARALRPYAVQVQLAAAMIGHATRPIGKPSPSPWRELARLEPAAAGLVLPREGEIGNFAGVVAMAKATPIVWPTTTVGPLIFLAQGSAGGDFLGALDASMNLAYAQAATGDLASARETVALVRTRMAALNTPAKPAAATPGAASAKADAPDLVALFSEGLVEPRLRLAEARIALAEGRTADAEAMTIGGKIPVNAAALDLLEALARSKPGASTATVKSSEAIVAEIDKQRGRSLGKLASTLLIAPESPRTLIDYKQSRPNILAALVGGALSMGTSLLGGIQRTEGFRSATNPDGTVKVEYIGGTPSAPMVQEMTLLRAAELAKAAGKPRFAIVDRKDYARFLTMSRYGVEESRTPSGYKTELTVRFVDAGADEAASFDTVALIDALGPLYYENAPDKS